MANQNPLGDLMKFLLLQNLRICSGCRRPNIPSNPDSDDWLITTFVTIPFGAKCPDCQTPEERAECAVEQAIGPKYKFEGSQLIELPKPEDGDDEDAAQSKAS